MSYSYLTGVTAAQLQWHLSTMNAIQRIKQVILQNQEFLYGEIHERTLEAPTSGLYQSQQKLCGMHNN